MLNLSRALQTKPKLWPCCPLLMAFFLCHVGGCSENHAPSISEISAQQAIVGIRFELVLQATDPDGDALNWSVTCPTIDRLSSRSELSSSRGEAHFFWTPQGKDVGVHELTFNVSDGEATSSIVVSLSVKSAPNNETVPTFSKPLGDGMVFDVRQYNCLDLEIEVVDPDSTEVEITQLNLIEGSTLQTLGPLQANFHWCPTADQINKQLFELQLQADDHDHVPPTLKIFSILLQTDLPSNCPGDPPTISHNVLGAQTTSAPITLTAIATDDKGLKMAPLLYYTVTKPADDGSSVFSQLIMTVAASGSSTYQAAVPNPTLSLAAGQSRTLYYYFVAEDNDDSQGNCDHRTRLPVNSYYEVTITKPQGNACSTSASCSAGFICDGQTCIGDACIPVDTDNNRLYWEQSSCPVNHFCPRRGPDVAPSHCAKMCSTDADCPQSGNYCKVFDTKKGCGLAGNRLIGEACSSFNDCSGKAMCLSLPGGYCSISNCDSYNNPLFSGPCPSGSFCIPISDNRFAAKLHWVCLKSCNSDTDCRTSENYKCKTLADDKSYDRKVCML